MYPGDDDDNHDDYNSEEDFKASADLWDLCSSICWKDWKAENGKCLSPLVGKGLWYGRVAPRQVSGLIEATVKNGRLIEELLIRVHDLQQLLANVVRQSCRAEK